MKKPLLKLRNSAARSMIMGKGGVHERPRSGKRFVDKQAVRRAVTQAMTGD